MSKQSQRKLRAPADLEPARSGARTLWSRHALVPMGDREDGEYIRPEGRPAPESYSKRSASIGSSDAAR